MGTALHVSFSRVAHATLLALLVWSVQCQAQDVTLLRPQPSGQALSNEAESSTSRTMMVQTELPHTLPSENDEESKGPMQKAMAAAVADGVTTGVALSSGAAEMNPLISVSPLGLITLTGIKLGVAKYADTLPKEEKRVALKTTTAAWSGAAINNVMVLLAAPPPFPIIAGLVTAFAIFHNMGQEYQREDELVAIKTEARLAVERDTPQMPSEMAFADAPLLIGQGPTRCGSDVATMHPCSVGD